MEGEESNKLKETYISTSMTVGGSHRPPYSSGRGGPRRLFSRYLFPGNEILIWFVLSHIFFGTWSLLIITNYVSFGRYPFNFVLIFPRLR